MNRSAMTAAAFLVVAGSGPAFAQSLNLPARAYPVEGGWIAVGASAIKDPDIEPGPIGKLRYPVRYLVTIENETAAPVWIDLEWRLPDDKPARKSSDRVDPSTSRIFWRVKFGLRTDKPIDFRIEVFADDGRKQLIGAVDAAMQFDESEKELLYRAFAEPSKNIGLVGWPEMKGSLQDVPGTHATGSLLIDIQILLWKEESKRFLACEHKAIRAESYEPASSATLAALPDDPRRRVEERRIQGHVRFERWLMKSCDTLSTYEVLIAKMPDLSTEVRAERIEEAMPERAPAAIELGDRASGFFLPRAGNATDAVFGG